MAYRRESAAISVWLGWCVVSLELEEGYYDQLCLPIIRGRYLLTSHICMPQNGHKDLYHTRADSPGSFPLLAGRRPRSFCCVLEAPSLSITRK